MSPWEVECTLDFRKLCLWLNSAHEDQGGLIKVIRRWERGGRDKKEAWHSMGEVNNQIYLNRKAREEFPS